MSDNANFGFGKFVPGFDFLQNLASNAVKGATGNIPQLPNMSNWVAPTLSVEDLEKRIEELKAVQFWLDQNAVALKATIQALEVQKMTLATLKGMNFNMGDVANAFKLKAADTVMSACTRPLGLPARCRMCCGLPPLRLQHPNRPLHLRRSQLRLRPPRRKPGNPPKGAKPPPRPRPAASWTRSSGGVR